ncbi:hypothetical protein QE152_g40554 [Popillia japonica]|uniref:Uncharacterized protein n=1 Tax=Popillia japonica TaxID=7064 RepID=A0AAW1HFX6_POPJA
MEPLDIAFMSPFKTYYSQQIEMWLKQNPGHIVNAFQICKLMCPAYLRSVTAAISANGFRKCGIYPLNRNVFADHDFLIERQSERTPPAQPIENRLKIEEETTNNNKEIPPTKTELINRSASSTASTTKKQYIRAEDRQDSSRIITSTPYKDELEQSLRKLERKKS